MDAQVDRMTRRLLALAWMLPPLVFPRSLQISRTLRAMSERGWRTTVVAVPPDVEAFAARDEELRRFYEGHYDIRYVEPREEVRSSPLWLKAMRRLAGIQNTRDPNWILRASAELQRQAEIARPDALVSFAQPWINHLAALRAKRRNPDIAWIVHFSDPWVDSPYFKPEDARAKETALRDEANIIEAADRVIFTTPETVNLVMAKYPTEWRRKVHVVPHGYEAALLDESPPRVRGEAFTITHTGNLYEGREPIALFAALRTLLSETPEASIHLNLIGHATDLIREKVETFDLSRIVTMTPNVAYTESLKIARAADLLLVIDAPAANSVFFPSKIVDYLPLRRPILALTPSNGASARVLGGLGLPIVDPTDQAGILIALRGAIRRWQRGDEATPIPAHDAIQHYDIDTVAADFDAIISDAGAQRGHGHA